MKVCVHMQATQQPAKPSIFGWLDVEVAEELATKERSRPGKDEYELNREEKEKHKRQFGHRQEDST